MKMHTPSRCSDSLPRATSSPSRHLARICARRQLLWMTKQTGRLEQARSCPPPMLAYWLVILHRDVGVRCRHGGTLWVDPDVRLPSIELATLTTIGPSSGRRQRAGGQICRTQGIASSNRASAELARSVPTRFHSRKNFHAVLVYPESGVNYISKRKPKV